MNRARYGRNWGSGFQIAFTGEAQLREVIVDWAFERSSRTEVVSGNNEEG